MPTIDVAPRDLYALQGLIEDLAESLLKVRWDGEPDDPFVYQLAQDGDRAVRLLADFKRRTVAALGPPISSPLGTSPRNHARRPPAP